jgi:hypothetical protein
MDRRVRWMIILGLLALVVALILYEIFRTPSLVAM